MIAHLEPGIYQCPGCGLRVRETPPTCTSLRCGRCGGLELVLRERIEIPAADPRPGRPGRPGVESAPVPRLRSQPGSPRRRGGPVPRPQDCPVSPDGDREPGVGPEGGGPADLGESSQAAARKARLEPGVYQCPGCGLKVKVIPPTCAALRCGRCGGLELVLHERIEIPKEKPIRAPSFGGVFGFVAYKKRYG
ncbi:MAG: hypothetical protein SFU83_18330 [Meiothermus sp.]|nr:hypothetical protein [Meiothermus sp.]